MKCKCCVFSDYFFFKRTIPGRSWSPIGPKLVFFHPIQFKNTRKILDSFFSSAPARLGGIELLIFSSSPGVLRRYRRSKGKAAYMIPITTALHYAQVLGIHCTAVPLYIPWRRYESHPSNSGVTRFITRSNDTAVRRAYCCTGHSPSARQQYKQYADPRTRCLPLTSRLR